MPTRRECVRPSLILPRRARFGTPKTLNPNREVVPVLYRHSFLSVLAGGPSTDAIGGFLHNSMMHAGQVFTNGPDRKKLSSGKYGDERSQESETRNGPACNEIMNQ